MVKVANTILLFIKSKSIMIQAGWPFGGDNNIRVGVSTKGKRFGYNKIVPALQMPRHILRSVMYELSQENVWKIAYSQLSCRRDENGDRMRAVRGLYPSSKRSVAARAFLGALCYGR